MNSTGLKYKSFFYSLAIHLALGIIVLSVYLKEDEKHEVYSLINLKNIQISTPATAKPLIKEQNKLKKQAKKEIAKTAKKTTKAKLNKKIIPLKPERVEKIVLIEPESVKPLEKLKKEIEVREVKPIEKEVSLVEKSSPVLSVSEPKISYEAQYMQDNIALINALIKKNLSYPRLAKKRGLQGKAMVSFTLNKQGEVLDIKALGSLSSILKKSAIKTVKKASSSFPHPSQVLALRIPIVYKLH